MKLVVSQHLNSAYLVIDAERCKGCRYCVSACPLGIIGLAAHINQNGYIPAEVIKEKAYKCTGCISCAIMCPDTAISVYRHNQVLTKPAP